MNIAMWVIWFVAAGLLLGIEGLTLGLTTIWFAIGALCAMIVALLGGSLVWQIMCFVVISVLMLSLTRKIFVEKLKTGEEMTNIDSMIGKVGEVRIEIKPYKPGVIFVWGQEWTAIPYVQDQEFEPGSKVRVVGVEGVKLLVEEFKK